MTRLDRDMRVWMTRTAAALGLAAALGCQERLTAPGECPASCPGGSPVVRDTVLAPLPGSDSAFQGYVTAGAGPALLVSDGLPGADARALVRFNPLPDSIQVSGEARVFTIDSVVLTLGVVARDTAVRDLRFFLYRLPPALDSTVTYGDVAPRLVPANLIDSIPVPDSVVSGVVRTVLSGAALARVAIPPADSGVLTLAVALRAGAPTGVRIGSLTAGGSAPAWITHVRVDVADTALQRQTISRGAAFNTFVFSAPPALDPDLLTVGGAPSARALLRFPWPAYLRDSVQLVRATLELVPAAPAVGLPNDPGRLDARGLLSDLGSKSPLLPTNFGQVDSVAVVAGTTDTLRIEVVRVVRAWQGAAGLPPALFVTAAPEASGFTRVVAGSTRGGPGAPRLRLTYLPSFPTERP